MRHEARDKWTPLHCAASAGDAHACAILVEAGADVDAKVLSSGRLLESCRPCVSSTEIPCLYSYN